MNGALARGVVSLRGDRRILLVLFVGLLAGCLPLLFLYAKPAAAVDTPEDFTDTLVASVSSPTALAFTPEGRMLVLAKKGSVRVYKDGELLQTPALDLSDRLCTGRERGLLGVAVDPDFGTTGNNYVYLYYTFKKSSRCPTDGEPTNPDNPVNRVSRFVMSGDTIDPSSEEVLIDNIHSPTGNHNSGDLSFGKDGYLYVSVGDGQCDYADDSGCSAQNDAARDEHVLLGKILRITRDGGIPPTNPYQGADSARCGLTGSTSPGKKCQETFASGLRNPFRYAFDPNAAGTRFFINNVGQNAWEEINLGESGADYGWNVCEGNHDNPIQPGSVDCSADPYTPPIHEYSHGTGCSAITGGAFVPDGVWPASYDGSYLFGDYVCGKIFKLSPNGAGGFTRTEFVSGLGTSSAVAMAFGPHQGGQALYYTTYGGNGPGTGDTGGEVRRIAYTGNVNRPPTAALSANPTSGPLPLEVNFDGTGSIDPDAGDTLSYLWDFGDGSEAETVTATTSHTYPTDGTYNASLRVRDDDGAVSQPTQVRIDAGNEAPAPVIESPSEELRFRVGQQITLSASATDPEDGPLPAGSLEWEVIQHHNGTHTHPFFSGIGDDLTFQAPAPEDIEATEAGNYLEVRLTATDSAGRSKTVVREVHPNKVGLTFGSNQSGLSLQVNGATLTTPHTLISWEGYELSVSAPSPQKHSGRTYLFSSWSDGKEMKHDIVTGATPNAYTAAFKACTIKGTPGADVLGGTSGADIICGMGGNDTIRSIGGNDTIEGLGGNDELRGGGGADNVSGGAGADDLYGEGGKDAVNSFDGTNGNDSLDGGPGTNTMATDASERSIVGFP